MAEAYFAGGCFWGVEHLLENQPGVIRVESGYMGGKAENPQYKQVVTGRTGHAETVRVLFDPTQTDYQILAKHFFEIHDPSQVNRQGPDVGTQYRSAVFVADPTQEAIIRDLIKQLRQKGFTVNTVVDQAGVFWPAEKYHQNYYKKTGKAPYCHAHTPRF
jgi:peptide methionine sulfoxide reductase msrA/msrB